MYSQTSIENPQGIFAQTSDHFMQAPGSGIPVMTSKHQDQTAELEQDDHVNIIYILYKSIYKTIIIYYYYYYFII